MVERPNTVAGLIEKRREIAGQIEHLQAQLRELVIALDHVEATIRLFDPEIDLGPIKARPVPPQHQAFKGEVSRIVLATLRNAKIPLTTEDIAKRVMAERGLDTANKALLRLMAKRTGSCLRNWREKRHVTSSKGFNQQTFWALAPS